MQYTKASIFLNQRCRLPYIYVYDNSNVHIKIILFLYLMLISSIFNYYSISYSSRIIKSFFYQKQSVSCLVFKMRYHFIYLKTRSLLKNIFYFNKNITSKIFCIQNTLVSGVGFCFLIIFIDYIIIYTAERVCFVKKF